MSIPAVREVRETDDGCSVYQCLNCYGDWESRSSPAAFGDYAEYLKNSGRWEEAKKSFWKCCPICGCTWEKYLSSKEKIYYPPLSEDRIRTLKYQLQERYFDLDSGELISDWSNDVWLKNGGPCGYPTENREHAVNNLRALRDQEKNEECRIVRTEYRILPIKIT